MCTSNTTKSWVGYLYVTTYTGGVSLGKYPTQVFRKVRQGLNTRTRHFGKFCTTSIPVPTLWEIRHDVNTSSRHVGVNSARPQQKYPTLGGKFGKNFNAGTRHFRVSTVRPQYLYQTPRKVRYAHQKYHRYRHNLPTIIPLRIYTCTCRSPARRRMSMDSILPHSAMDKPTVTPKPRRHRLSKGGS